MQILDYGVDGASPYIAMELLDGESLAERQARQARLSPSETARIIQHISRALGRAHEAGIVHRDLKPENVFIVKNDDEEVAKVLEPPRAGDDDARVEPHRGAAAPAAAAPTPGARARGRRRFQPGLGHQRSTLALRR